MVKKIIMFAVLFITVFSFSACNKGTPARRIEKMCGIELPKKMEIVFDYYDYSFDGSFALYTVFKLKEEPTEFLNSEYSYKQNNGALAVHEGNPYTIISGMLSFSEERNSSFEKETDEWLAGRVKSSPSCLHPNALLRAIPKEYFPDWESRYLREKINYVSIFYFPDKLELVFQGYLIS